MDTSISHTVLHHRLLKTWRKDRGHRSQTVSPEQRVSSHRGVPWRWISCIEGVLSSECHLKQVYCIEGVLSSECHSETGLLYRGCPLIRMSLEDRFYCIEGVLSSECHSETGLLHRGCPLIGSVPSWQVLLYRGCPLIGVCLEDRFYCIEGVLSSECPIKTGFAV